MLFWVGSEGSLCFYPVVVIWNRRVKPILIDAVRYISFPELMKTICACASINSVCILIYDSVYIVLYVYNVPSLKELYISLGESVDQQLAMHIFFGSIVSATNSFAEILFVCCLTPW